MKPFPAIGLVSWLQMTNVFRDHLRLRHQNLLSWGSDDGVIRTHQVLMMGTDIFPETWVIFNQLTRLIAREDFIGPML
jgi:hypothetical protein